MLPEDKLAKLKLDRALLRRNDSIEELEFSLRVLKILLNARIWTVGDLVTKTENELLKIHGIGPGLISEIKMVLDLDGLTLGMKLRD